MSTLFDNSQAHIATRWIGRIGLAAAVGVALLGVLDPKERLTEIAVRGDHLSHAMLSYGIALSLIAAFRRASRLAVAAFVMLIGVALEGAQGFGLFGGDAQLGDLIADAVGVTLALLPALAGARISARSIEDAKRACEPESPAP